MKAKTIVILLLAFNTLALPVAVALGSKRPPNTAKCTKKSGCTVGADHLHEKNSAGSYSAQNVSHMRSSLGGSSKWVSVSSHCPTECPYTRQNVGHAHLTNQTTMILNPERSLDRIRSRNAITNEVVSKPRDSFRTY